MTYTLSCIKLLNIFFLIYILGKICSTIIPNTNDKDSKAPQQPPVKPILPERRQPLPPPPRVESTTMTTEQLTTEEGYETTLAGQNTDEEGEFLDTPDVNGGNFASNIFGYVTGSGFCAALLSYATCKSKKRIMDKIRKYKVNRGLGVDVRKKEKRGKTSPPPTIAHSIQGVQTITNPFYTGCTEEEIEIMRRRPYSTQGLYQNKLPTATTQGPIGNILLPPTPIETLIPELSSKLISTPDSHTVQIHKPSSFNTPPL